MCVYVDRPHSPSSEPSKGVCVYVCVCGSYLCIYLFVCVCIYECMLVCVCVQTGLTHPLVKLIRKGVGVYVCVCSFYLFIYFCLHG